MVLFVAAACIAVVLVNNAPELAFFSRERGVLFAAVSFPLDVLYYLVSGIGIVFGWIARQAVGEPTPGAVVEAFTEMGAKRWPPVPVSARAAVRPRASLPTLPWLIMLQLTTRRIR